MKRTSRLAFASRFITLRAYNEAENREPQPQNKRGKKASRAVTRHEWRKKPGRVKMIFLNTLLLYIAKQ